MSNQTGNFKSRLIMANNAELKLQSTEKTAKGSLIDIDVVLENPIGTEEISDIVEQAHNEEKELFFSLLDPNFLKTLNPEY